MAKSGFSIETQVVKSNQVSAPTKSVSLPQSLANNLKNVDTKYASQLDYWTKQNQNVNISQEQATQQAQNELSDYYNTQTQKLNEKYDTKQSKWLDQHNKTDFSFYKNIANLNENFEKDKRSLKAEATDKGWRTSSIYENLEKELKQNYSQNKSNLNTEYFQKSSGLEFEKQLLLQEKEAALETFNISYAQKLDKKIEQITNEFNALHKQEQAKTGEKLNQTILTIQQEKANEVLKYIKDFSKKDALQFLSDNNESLLSQIGNVALRALTIFVKDKNG